MSVLEIGLLVVFGIAFLGLLYAYMCAKKVSQHEMLIQKLLSEQKANLASISALQQKMGYIQTELGQKVQVQGESLSHFETKIDAAVFALQNEQQILSQKVAALGEQDPQIKLYAKAAKLIAEGADIEEIITACDLPRAELEILQSMQGSS